MSPCHENKLITLNCNLIRLSHFSYDKILFNARLKDQMVKNIDYIKMYNIEMLHLVVYLAYKIYLKIQQ